LGRREEEFLGHPNLAAVFEEGLLKFAAKGVSLTSQSVVGSAGLVYASREACQRCRVVFTRGENVFPLPEREGLEEEAFSFLLEPQLFYCTFY